MAATAIATALPDDIVRIVRQQFVEMPGMRLSTAQVGRLWNIDDREGEQAVEQLLDEGVLVRDGAGRVCLATLLSH